MLQYLKIKNLALWDEVFLEMDSGFTAVTGETGAGKSILLGALSLLSGARTDKTVIRQGADQVEVEGAVYFNNSSKIDGFLESNGLPVCEEGVLLIQRRIHRQKMPRIQVNGSMATLAQLQALGEWWVDFHGPGEPQKLFQERYQLEMLDLYGDNKDLLDEYRESYAEWYALKKEIKQLETGERLSDDEIEFVKKQIGQIDQLQISRESIEALERDYTRTSNAHEFMSLAAECVASLTGEQGLTESLNRLVGYYESMAELDADSHSLLERARSVLLELQDLGEETERLASDFDFDAAEVEAVTERMDLWQELRRKYGGNVEAILNKRGELEQKLASQGNVEGVLQSKIEKACQLEQTLRKQAKKLRIAREQAAMKLAEKTSQLLTALGFRQAKLKIEVKHEPDLNESGDSHCVFLFAPNAGQMLLPLKKIASSGEMARVMLALKTVLAEADATPLLVFDEVDANVGGEVGRSVGMEMAELSKRHQVFCVTHLPQVASLAKSHFVVRKLQDEASTTVSIEPIHETREPRLDELARMLGDRHAESARAHAEALLKIESEV